MGNPKYNDLTWNVCKSIRDAVFLRHDNHCYYCNAPLVGIHKTIDHVKPVSRGGKHNIENLVACCLKCNAKKNNKNKLEFAELLVRQTEKELLAK